jgi:hypothetical protein
MESTLQYAPGGALLRVGKWLVCASILTAVAGIGLPTAWYLVCIAVRKMCVEWRDFKLPAPLLDALPRPEVGLFVVSLTGIGLAIAGGVVGRWSRGTFLALLMNACGIGAACFQHYLPF